MSRRHTHARSRVNAHVHTRVFAQTHGHFHTLFFEHTQHHSPTSTTQVLLCDDSAYFMLSYLFQLFFYLFTREKLTYEKVLQWNLLVNKFYLKRKFCVKGQVLFLVSQHFVQ